MKPVFLHPDADQEWQASADYYAERSRAVAVDFNERVRGSFREIASNPDRYRFVRGFRPLQQYRLKRFPFSIIYLEATDRIWIVAVAHANREPGYWRYRTGEFGGNR